MTAAGARHLAPVSVMLSSGVDPARSLRAAHLAEDAGFDRVWITEDHFRKGAFSSAGALLGATSRLSIGLGVASAYTRSLALLAMEAATLRAMFPGRFELGVGAGSVHALGQLGRRPERLIGSLRDRFAVLRALLRGETATWRDEFDELTDVALQYPTDPGPLWVAAEGPQMLRLAARTADGIILSALSSPGYLRRVTEQIAPYVAERDTPLGLTAFVYVSVADDDETALTRARDFLSARLASGRASETLRASDPWPALEPLLGQPAASIASALDPDTVATFIPYGSRIPAGLEAALAAGASEVALAPIPVAGAFDVEYVVPELGRLTARLRGARRVEE